MNSSNRSCNNLFDPDYPPDSTVEYNWTEFQDDRLKRILADTIITINGRHTYHLETQMEKGNAAGPSLNECNEAKNCNNDYFMKPLLVNDRQGLYYVYSNAELPSKLTAMTISTKNAYNTSIFPCITSFTIAYYRVYNKSNRRGKRFTIRRILLNTKSGWV